MLFCWLATIFWTFGFDTVYAMPDMKDDKQLGLNSSALSLGGRARKVVSISYFLTSIMLGISAFLAGISLIFWPIWILVSLGMQQEAFLLKNERIKVLNTHFKNQVLLGSLLLLGLMLGKIN